jgi:hypothetical protein
MKVTRIGIVALAAALAAPPLSLAGVEAILGKWVAKAETPTGPVELELELRQEGAQVVGTAAMLQNAVPLTNLKFEDPELSLEMALGALSFKLRGTLKDGKFTGTYEQIGGDLKGPWSAERRAASATQAAAPSPAQSSGAVTGSWSSVSVTPQGELALDLALEQTGEKVTGTVSSALGSLPILNGSFRDSRLRYDVEFGGTTYRTEGTLSGDKFQGEWSAVGGTDKGAWSATRKAAVPAAAAAAASPAPAAAPAVPLDGVWNAKATTPGGDINFQATFKQSGETVTGSVVGPDGNTIPVLRAKLAGNALAFELEVGGATYRIETTLEHGKLTGKWTAVGTTESGAFSAEKKP